MASTYSANLRLELIGTGEQQGTWGSTTNTNLGTLIEEAIGGYTSVTVSDAGDTTLTTNNGTADQARNMVLNLTGTIGAARNVIVPAIEKVYIIKNATTGGFAVTVKVSGQTGVSVANGDTAIVYVDGTDVRSASPTLGTMSIQNASNVSITGGTISGLSNLSVANATVATQVRTNLSAAGSGSNTDLTSVYLDNAGLKLKDTNASHGLTIAPGSDLTADRTLTVTTGDAARTVTISDNATISQDYSTSGSPQFTAVNIGDATDTTVGRASAGVISVEGNHVPSPASQAQGDVLYHNGTTWARLAAGTNGDYLQTKGTGANPEWAAVAAGATVDEYTTGTGATWTKPSSATTVLVEAWGGGGSGGGGSASAPAGGGGGGAYSFVLVKFSDLVGTVTYTVGAGGTGVGSNTAGNAGGTSSVSMASFANGGTATLSAFGGGAGGINSAGGGGGGGGGASAVGANASGTSGGAGGGPFGGSGGLVSGPVLPTASLFGGGGGGYGVNGNSPGADSLYGGGGGAGGRDSEGFGGNGGGDSTYGGGGGGGAANSSTPGPAGASIFGGSGSAGAVDANNSSAGSTPGGGSGGTEGGTSGNGGGGMVRFTYW